MISRRITVALVCATLAVPALMYVRDLGASPPPGTARQASFDAKRMLFATYPCGSWCSVRMLGQIASHTWRLRLSSGSWHGCFDLDPGAFSYRPAHGFTGVNTAPCRLA